LIKAQVRAAFKEIPFTNEAAPLLAEFNQRRRLAKMGYHFDIRRLSAWKADCFVLIDSEIDRLECEEMNAGKGGR
jgi:hypothetical protein